MPDTYPRDFASEAQSWSTTVYFINGRTYSGIRSFDPPERNNNIDIIKGLRNDGVRWAEGDRDFPMLVMTMLGDTYRAMMKDVAADNGENFELANEKKYTFNVVEEVNPPEGIQEAKIRTTFSNLKISSVKEATRSQGTNGWEVTINFKLSESPKREEIV